MWYERIVFVITDDDEIKFYEAGTYFTTEILSADRFVSREDAECVFSRLLNDFQKKIFTKIIPIKITVSEPVLDE